MLGTFFEISTTPMQPVPCNESSLTIIVKKEYSTLIKHENTILCDRKGLHHDLEIFQARCYGCFLGISSTLMQLVTCYEFSLIIIVKQKIIH